MTALEQVNRYLRHLELRLRLLAASRGFAASAGLALLLTLTLVAISNRYQFAHSVVLPLRIVLFLSLASALTFALAFPLAKLTRRRVTRIAERAIPGLQERLLTATEHPDPANPFTELIAEDVLRVARENPASKIEATKWLWSFAGAGAIAAAVLIWLIAAGPGYWGYGASLLWTGSAHTRQRPLYDITVEPGDKTIRRKSDQGIKAELVGFAAKRVVLHARYGNADKWQDAAMQSSPDSNEYRFLFPAVSDAVEYYVQADATQSKHFKISVKDLPAVKRVRVTVHFPSGLGLKDVSDETSGDVRAVEGSQAGIAVLTDRPLEHGLLVFDNGKTVDLATGESNWTKAEFPVKKDGSYHVAVRDGAETIRISEDYFIEAKKDEPPSVKIVRPGRDPRVSPIEEVPVQVEAADDFGVRALDLHYSVNGGDEQVARFKSQGKKEEQGHTTLFLENFKLAPGDVVSMYATATDANKTAKSDILFAQAEAFDYKFSQSQQSGGMGGGGGSQDSNDISERQKQIIAATFNQLRGDEYSKTSAKEQAKFLSETEAKLGAQAKTLAERMANRELTQANPEFENFTKLMTFASAEMNEAVGELSPAKWHDALAPEQKALQSLLRAEALFRKIQVAFGQQSGGGGGGGAQRELARMFDLELDTSKNQYETGQSAGDKANEEQKAIDDAFERLQMLAKRQQELAQQRNQQQPAEQRWQEEQLRREAEELKKQIAQLAKDSQQGQQNGQQAQNGQQQPQGGQGSQSGQQGGSQSSGSQPSGSQRDGQQREMTRAMRQASEAVGQAENEMRKAVSNGDTAAQQRAAGQLAEAQRQMSGAMHRTAGDSLAELTQQSDAIATAQRELANRMKQMYGRGAKGNGDDYSSQGGESGEMPEMNDPDNPRYSGYYRRRMFPKEMRPIHRTTPEEQELASDKERLAKQLEQLQQGLHQQEQSLRQASPEASSKVRRALSDAEQKELALRMQKNAEWIREGFGDRNLGMEDNVTAGIEQLSRDLRGAQQALKGDEQAAQGGKGAETAEALAQVQQLRQMLEQAQGAARNGQRATGGQPGGQQNGPPGGQQAGQQPGQQSGQSGQWSQAGQPGQPSLGGGDGTVDRRDLQQAIGRLSALRGQISGQDRALGSYLGGTLGYLRDLNADPNKLQATIGQDAVASLERLEAELSRRLGEQQAQQGARSGATETSPEKYRDAVAEYFKKLSQTTPK